MQKIERFGSVQTAVLEQVAQGSGSLKYSFTITINSTLNTYLSILITQTPALSKSGAGISVLCGDFLKINKRAHWNKSVGLQYKIEFGT